MNSPSKIKIKKPPRSIIGKMYKNAHDFAGKTGTITFVSNGTFKFTLSDGTKSNENNIKIKATELDNAEIKIIDAALDPDFPSPRSPNCTDILFFERTNLPLQDQAIFVTGRLVTHLEIYAASESFAVKALYEVLFRNVIARTGSTEKFNSDDALYKQKSLSRAEIATLLERAISKRTFEASWHLVEAELNAAGITSVNIIKIHTSAIQYLRDRIRGEKRAILFSEQAEAAIEQNKENLDACGTIYEAAVLLRLHMTGPSNQNNFADLGPLLIEAFEAMNG